MIQLIPILDLHGFDRFLVTRQGNQCVIFDFVPLTVKAVHRTPFCSLWCVPDNAFPSLLNSHSMRDVTIAPSGPVATPCSAVVVLSKVAVRDQVHPSPENPETV